MVLSEAEKAQKVKEEKGFLANKKVEQARIQAEIKSDRETFNMMKAPIKEEKPEAPQRLLLRLRYDINGQKGRRPVELEGTTSTVSLFHFLQAVEEQFHVAPPRQVLRAADESKFPVEPKAEALPSYGSFGSVEAFPSLESLGLRNGQELFLTVADDDDA
ncbi:unnamed protein product, partial [Polarella glacialis]